MLRRLLYILLLCPLSSATVRQVGSGQTYTTIQACLTAAAAGDVCNVHSGTYTEQLNLSSSGGLGLVKTLQANPSDTVNVQSTSSPVVLFKSYWTISGINFTYNGSGAAPSVGFNAHGNDLDGVTISNTSWTVAGGSGSGFGLYLADCDLCTVSGTTVHISATTGTHDGMQFLFNSHLTVTDSIIYGEPCSTATHLEDGIVATGTDLIFRRLTMHDGCSFDNHPDAIVIQGDGDRNGNLTANVEISASTISDFSQLIYIDAIHGPMTGIKVLNNKLFETSTYRYGGSANKVNCAVFDGENVGGIATYSIDMVFYNNVLDCKQLHIYGSRLFASLGTGIVIKNNISLHTPFTGFYFPDQNATLDYNYYSQSDSTPIKWGGSNYSRASFISGGFGETNSSAGTANLNSDYSEKAISDTISKGVNLFSVVPTDFLGNPRPSSAAFDSGAYQFSSPGPPTLVRHRASTSNN